MKWYETIPAALIWLATRKGWGRLWWLVAGLAGAVAGNAIYDLLP